MSSLEELGRKLYKPEEDETLKKRLDLPSEFRPSSAPDTPPSPYQSPQLKPEGPWYVRGLAILSLLAVAIIVVTLLIVMRILVFDPRKVEVAVNAPTQIDAGEVISTDVVVSNGNIQAIERTRLELVFSEGTEVLTSPVPLSADRTLDVDIGRLRGRSNHRLHLELRMMGTRGEQKQLSAVVKFRRAEFGAEFKSEVNHPFSLLKVPIALTIQVPKVIAPSSKFNTIIFYKNESSIDFRNLTLFVTLPIDFKVESVEPAASQGLSWSIPELGRDAQGQIKIVGRLGTQTNYYSVSARINDQNQEVSSARMAQDVRAAPLSISHLINSQKSDQVVTHKPLEALNWIIAVTNTTDQTVNVVLRDATIRTQLDSSLGRFLDFSSLTVSDGGVWQEASRTIIWAPQTMRKLALLSPGQIISVNFQVRTLPNALPINVANVHLGGEVKSSVDSPLKPKELGEIERLGSDTVTGVRLGSHVTLTSRVLDSHPTLGITGPLPPETDILTSYIIELAITNTYNNLTDIVVEGIMPAYVNLPNKATSVASGENLQTDVVKNAFVWTIPRLEAGTGTYRPTKTFAYIVDYKPRSQEAGKMPEIVTEVRLRARDAHTQEALTAVTTPVLLPQPVKP